MALGERYRSMQKHILGTSVLLFTTFFLSTVYAHTIDARKYLATLMFDGEDWWDKGERSFPQSYTFNTTQDGNGDGRIDEDDACENLISFKLGGDVFGTGRTGIPNRGPNDQRPAIYFHITYTGPYAVYQYWLYYADNDWYNNHEHDWEKYFVYELDGVPQVIMISNHWSFNKIGWTDIRKDNQHPMLGVDGGSHAFKNAAEDGVVIRYNGQITKNNGRLLAGDGDTIPWVIYSNIPWIPDVVAYAQSPNYFNYDDPDYILQAGDYGDPRPAPWMRPEWYKPPTP